MGGAQVALAQGNEGNGKERVITLFISGVEKDLMTSIEEIGAGMRPPVRRNDLIVWILEEFSAGRLVAVGNHEGARMAEGWG